MGGDGRATPGRPGIKIGSVRGLCILSPLGLHLSILPDLSVECITYLISCHLVSIGLGLYACMHCVKFYARSWSFLRCVCCVACVA